MAERQTLGDAVGIRRIHQFGSSKPAAPSGPFSLEQMPLAGVPTHNFAIGGDFEPLGHRLLRFDTLWTSHNISLSLKRAQYKKPTRPMQA